MSKRFIFEFFSFALLALAALLFGLKVYVLFYIAMIAWYSMFGLVGIAYILSLSRKLRLSNLCLAITIPVFLIPLRKSFYYWVKSVNVILNNPENINLAYEYAIKVKPNNLYSNNAISNFYTYLSSLYMDLGQKEVAINYINKAKDIPHRSFVDDTIKNLESLIYKE